MGSNNLGGSQGIIARNSASCLRLLFFTKWVAGLAAVEGSFKRILIVIDAEALARRHTLGLNNFGERLTCCPA